MKVKIFAVVLTLALALSVLAVTMQVTKMAYADRDSKTKIWAGEGTLATSHCEKPDDCKGFPLNKVTRNVCEENAGDKCKQEQLPK
jgi:hypothetical protein